MKSNNLPIVLCTELAPEQPFRMRKLLFTHSELNSLMSSIIGEVQSCQQALNDENDKRDMYKVCLNIYSQGKYSKYKIYNVVYVLIIIYIFFC